MSDPFGESRQTVTVLGRARTGERDSYGNDVYAAQETEVPGCLIAPGTSGDDQSDADRTTTTATIYDPSGTWPGGTDNRARFDGATWEIAGEPERWSGAIAGTVIHVRKVRG